MTQPNSGFAALGLAEPILAAVHAAGYTEPTGVQQAAIGPGLEGKDLMVSSETGSGKTAAFLLPALHKLTLNKPAPQKEKGKGVRPGRGQPRVLILTPTRELAQQIEKQAKLYGKNLKWLRVASMLGGMPYFAQMKALRDGVDIMIATPGRLLDHIDSGKLDLSTVETLVLDEADRMLDMGFIEDIEAIAKATPASRQTVMFSATFAGRLATLAQQMLREPTRLELKTHRDVHSSITQHLHWVDDKQHKQALLQHWLKQDNLDQAIVFTSTQMDADWLADTLERDGHQVAALHGGLPQPKRNRILNGLRTKRVRVLVATDVAARGIDVPTISHVINYGLPMNAEDYVHRIGRTGRAGRSGTAITLASADDKFKIRRIERFTGNMIPLTQIEGLEPKRAVPGFKDGNRSGGGRFERDGERRGGGRFNDNRRPGGRFEGRSEGRFENRDNRSFDRSRDNNNVRSFEPRGPKPFDGAPEQRTGGFADRGPRQERGQFNRDERAPRPGFNHGFASQRGQFDNGNRSEPRRDDRSFDNRRSGPRQDNRFGEQRSGGRFENRGNRGFDQGAATGGYGKDRNRGFADANTFAHFVNEEPVTGAATKKFGNRDGGSAPRREGFGGSTQRRKAA